MNKDRWAHAQEIVRAAICKHLNPFTSTPAMAKEVVEALAKERFYFNSRFEEPKQPPKPPSKTHTLVAKLFDNGDGRLVIGDVQVAEIIREAPRDTREHPSAVYREVMDGGGQKEPDALIAKGSGIVHLANTLQQYGDVVMWRVAPSEDGSTYEFSGVVKKREPIRHPVHFDPPRQTLNPAPFGFIAPSGRNPNAPPAKRPVGWVCPRCKDRREYLKQANAHESEGMVPCNCEELYPQPAQSLRFPFNP